MVKLIASDLDGTLLQNGARDVNPIVFDQIRTLKEHGIMFAAASGRQYLNLRRLFTPVQDDIAYIAENGSLCIYNEETISKGIIEQDLAYRILDESCQISTIQLHYLRRTCLLQHLEKS